MEEIINLRDCPALLEKASLWFHKKWGIPQAAYRESMEAGLEGHSPVPQWYLVLDGAEIAGGAGVIENDFHDRKDLSPNVCGVYVEEAYRNRGIAGRMLQKICDSFAENGVDILYLLTDHTSFYERYGWDFFCMAQGDGEAEPSRIYRRFTQIPSQE